MITPAVTSIVAHAVHGIARYEDRQDGQAFLDHIDRRRNAPEIVAEIAARRAVYEQEVDDIFWNWDDDNASLWGGAPEPEPEPTWLGLVGLQERADEFQAFATNRRTVRAHAASPVTLGRRHLSVVPNA